MEGWTDGLINIMKSMHTVHYDAAIRRSEALTRATARMHPEDTLLSEGETTTEEHAVCDPTDRELPGQAGPQTGSSFVVTRGWRTRWGVTASWGQGFCLR